jgi:hypothetical protein
MLVKFSEQNKTGVIEEVMKEEVTIKEEPKELSEEIDEDVYEEMKNKFIEKKLMEERDLKYKPTQDDLDKLDRFLKNINYQGPKFEESKEEKINPNQEDLDKLQEVLNQYSNTEEPIQEMVEEKPENDIVYTIQEETETIEEDEIEKVFFNPEESEVLYSDDSKTVETIDIDKPEQEIKPEPIEMSPTAKILNYFKRND